MNGPNERRHTWKRIVGIERRGAPVPMLEGHPLPDPTLLEDEEFWAERPESVVQAAAGEDDDFRALK